MSEICTRAAARRHGEAHRRSPCPFPILTRWLPIDRHHVQSTEDHASRARVADGGALETPNLQSADVPGPCLGEVSKWIRLALQPHGAARCIPLQRKESKHSWRSINDTLCARQMTARTHSHGTAGRQTVRASLELAPVHTAVLAVLLLEPVIRLLEMAVAQEAPRGADRRRVLRCTCARASVRRSGVNEKCSPRWSGSDVFADRSVHFH